MSKRLNIWLRIWRLSRRRCSVLLADEYPNEWRDVERGYWTADQVIADAAAKLIPK